MTVENIERDFYAPRDRCIVFDHGVTPLPVVLKPSRERLGLFTTCVLYPNRLRRASAVALGFRKGRTRPPMHIFFPLEPAIPKTRANTLPTAARWHAPIPRRANNAEA